LIVHVLVLGRAFAIVKRLDAAINKVQVTISARHHCRGVPMRNSADYRELAGHCVRLAQAASTPEHRSMLLNIAHAWLRLAEGEGGTWTPGALMGPALRV
jgi:hypothetical protein